MEFIALRALQGDAFIIKSSDTNILIDAGMPSTYGQIEDHLDDKTLDAVFITHVDYDHLGGLFTLVTDESFDLSRCDFYMNHPEFPTEFQGEEVGFRHGHSLKQLLEERNKKFYSISENQKLSYGNINIKAFSPDQDIINRLYESWEDNVVYDEGILRYKKRQTQSADIINKSSVILLLSCDEHKILMLGDSHAETASICLRKQGYDFYTPLKLSLVKLSHHGSQHNTNQELLRLLNCSSYYISTNGGRYEHPDTQTIKLLQERAKELGVIFDIYLNYDIKEDISHRCDFPTPNLRFIEQCSLEYL